MEAMIIIDDVDSIKSVTGTTGEFWKKNKVIMGRNPPQCP